MLQLDKMDASARQKAEMAQKIAQELLKSSSHRLASAPLSMPALNTEQSSLVRAAQQKAAEIAVQVLTLSSPLPVCLVLDPVLGFSHFSAFLVHFDVDVSCHPVFVLSLVFAAAFFITQSRYSAMPGFLRTCFLVGLAPCGCCAISHMPACF